MTQECGTGGWIEFIEIQTTELCTADPNKIRIMAQASPFPAGLLPYVAAAIPRASYSAEMGSVTWKEELRTHSIFASSKVTITQLGNREEAMERLEELKRKLNDIWARRDTIDLNAKKRRIGPWISCGFSRRRIAANAAFRPAWLSRSRFCPGARSRATAWRPRRRRP